MHRAAQRMDNHEQQMDFFTEAMIGPRTRADHVNPKGNEAHGGKERSWV